MILAYVFMLDGGKTEENYCWGGLPQFADIETSFEPNLPTKRLRSAQFADIETSFEPNLPTKRLRSAQFADKETSFSPICRQRDLVQPNLPTKRRRSAQFADKETSFEPTFPTETSFEPNFRQRGPSLRFICNTTLTSTIDIRQMCRQAKFWGDYITPTPCGYTLMLHL